MPTKTHKTTRSCDYAIALRLDHPVDLAHYLRQATITLRRHSSTLNYVWCKHHQPVGNVHLWKH